MSRPNPRERCPTPHKKRHPTTWQAENALSSVWRSRTHGGPLPVRVYACDCGGYHLTHVPLDKYLGRTSPRPPSP